jgi:hypothetical protein
MRETIVNPRTHLDPEEKCYPHGGQHRKFTARLGRTDYLVTGKCGLPDTYFSIPGHARIRGKRVRGYVTYDGFGDGEFVFVPYEGS